ncbi:class I lanthipeptide [Kordia sp.]|uniref:class I lanthipeptide n=1 Tax=Kordia sp. TaxID=1965332 RepID=UPI003B5CEED3
MKKKHIKKSLKLSKSNIANLADNEVNIVKGGGSYPANLCPSFIPILCLYTIRSCPI